MWVCSQSQELIKWLFELIINEIEAVIVTENFYLLPYFCEITRFVYILCYGVGIY